MKSVQHELIHAIVLEVKPYPWGYFGDIVESPNRISFNISRRYACGATFDFRRGYIELKKTPVIRSPYALDLVEFIRMSDEERDKLYTHNNDDLSEPYTIIDVITKVYHRCFIDDLRESVSGYPGYLEGI